MDHDITPQKNNIKYFLISWDCEGIEYIEDVTKYHPDEWAKETLFKSIKTGEKADDNPLSTTVTHLTLRARFNSQRHYEIYLFTADNSITYDDISKWGDDDPQSLVDFVRKNYVKQIYSDRVKAKNQRIV